MEFNFYNPNPNGIKTGDCVIRALIMASDGFDWDSVYKMVCDIGFAEKVMPNDDKVWRKVLTDKFGYKYNALPAVKGKQRMTVQKFTETHKTGTYVLRLANHIVTVRGGQFHDTWNCADCCVYGYYSKD